MCILDLTLFILVSAHVYKSSGAYFCKAMRVRAALPNARVRALVFPIYTEMQILV